MVALTVNTHSSNIPCLNIFFKYMEKYIGHSYFENVYLFIDPCDYTAPEYVTTIEYNPNDCFTYQMGSCLSQVKEDILLYCNEDYIFYEQARLDVANELLEKLINSNFSFIKFVHTDIEPYKMYAPNLLVIDKTSVNNFSQTLSFWKTQDILNIHRHSPPAGIGLKGNLIGHLEDAAKDVCRHLNTAGLCYYNGEPKRGGAHFDTEVFPHVASALVKGSWNIHEYPELKQILEKENIEC